MKLCPINMQGQECIKVGPDNKPIIDEMLCTGCGICPKRCPFGAIDIINLPEQLDKPPINRYGRNGFHLYSMPLPQVNAVVGIIGRNGTGKSTAMKVLAGLLTPNLGGDEPAEYEKIKSFFKGSTTQHYVEQVHNKKITVAYKPQQVDLLPYSTKGRVGDLLTKSDERKQIKSVCDQLSLNHLLDRDISQLSGGELQRVAIAATALKNATVYIFDEPSSFLDIKQRLAASQFIKTLATPTTSVLVVEHDIVILDAMTDHIHILYGKPACYGVASLAKPSRNGINTFLSGFIRDENMRFRNHEIKFLSKPQESRKITPKLTTWNDLKLTQGEFTLNAPTGTLFKKEVVGVVGENGIGKTTFVKLLAQALAPTSGSIDTKIKVSYKPQYLDSTSEHTVAEVVRDALAQHQHQLIEPLEIEPLLEKKINTLSGGELQRVAICAALSKEADLYLLDEPSAYLDVEQRLNVSKIIRDFCDTTEKTVLVVDHDIVFIDYVSDRLIVFTGTPGIKGLAEGPFTMEEGMNLFLTTLGITLRRDEDTNRPRINKEGSVKDREQKKNGKLYYQ